MKVTYSTLANEVFKIGDFSLQSIKKRLTCDKLSALRNVIEPMLPSIYCRVFGGENFAMISDSFKKILPLMKKQVTKRIIFQMLSELEFGSNGGWTKETFIEDFGLTYRNFSRDTKELFDLKVIAVHQGFIMINPYYIYQGTKNWHYRAACWDAKRKDLPKAKFKLTDLMEASDC